MAIDGAAAAAAANAAVRWHSHRGSLPEMEASYVRLKRSGFVADRRTIRAAATAYLRQRKLHALGEFVRDVGLRRRDLGNLLWNLLLLSYAAAFKMKSLQREFIAMSSAGFSPDLTTFNLRSVAFSRMSMMWDLHLGIQHMRRCGVAPDLVTVGCVVDAYVDRGMARNVEFALNATAGSAKGLEGRFPMVDTDPIVFEAMGKGEFHSSSEAFLEFSDQRDWSYEKLVSVYLRKCYRKNQIFWNY